MLGLTSRQTTLWRFINFLLSLLLLHFCCQCAHSKLFQILLFNSKPQVVVHFQLPWRWLLFGMYMRPSVGPVFNPQFKYISASCVTRQKIEEKKHC